MKKSLPILLAAVMLLTACSGGTSKGTNLMNGVKGTYVTESEDMPWEGHVALTDFGLSILKTCANDKSVLISPLSIALALGMTMNGAAGDTLAEMEQVLGLPQETLNKYLKSLSNRQEGEIVHTANGIWIRDDVGFTANQAFLQANADYYDAALRATPFDESTIKEINRFVSDNTKGMIPQIIEEIPEAAVMYLVNALSFECDWQYPYKGYQVGTGTFTTEAGEEQKAEFMYSTEYQYIENEDLTGFLRPYEGERYAFVALLPREGKTVAECLSTLTGEGLRTLLLEAQQTRVETSIPQFEKEYTRELNNDLTQLGMGSAFEAGVADFSNMGTMENGMPLYIGRVIHKTHIAVTPQGTKAGAATMVEVESGAAMPQNEVYLNRPFIYLIVDTKTMAPLFMGTMMEV